VVRMSGALPITRNLTEEGFLKGPKMK
jgi:hypothetical protein